MNNTIQLSIIESLVKILVPTSPAYGNTIAFEKPQTCSELKAKLQPGDVILSRTNSLLYEAIRRFMGIKYDHVAVILNNKEVIHISPPIISKIDMEYIMNPSREPLIIRPNLQDKQKFLTVIHNFLGQKYNTGAIPKIMLNQIKSKLEMINNNSYSQANLKYSRVCSDAVIYSLCRSSPKMKQIAQSVAAKGKFIEIGFFLPDQVADILLANNSEIILKSNFQQEYKSIQILSSLKKGAVNSFKKVKNIILKPLSLDNYRFSKSEVSENSTNKSKSTHIQKFLLLQVLSLIVALAQALGAPINAKLQYSMIILNIVMMLGQIQELKQLKNFAKAFSPKL